MLIFEIPTTAPTFLKVILSDKSGFGFIGTTLPPCLTHTTLKSGIQCATGPVKRRLQTSEPHPFGIP